MGYQKAFNLILTPREDGKTTEWVSYAYSAFLAGKTSLIIRRNVVDITEAYIGSIQEIINKFHDEDFIFKYSKGELKDGIVRIYVKGNLFAIIIALSVTIARIKSLVLRNVKYIFFDEFIVNPEFKEKYLPNEAGRFKELYNTFYREATEPIKCFFLGNPYSHYNPYFTWLNVDTKSLYAGCIIAKDNYVVWLHQLSDKLKEWILSRNPLYEFDDSYRKYGFEGVPICDENIKLGDLPNNYYLRFLFRIEGKYIGVYKNYLYNDGEDKYWVGFISNFGKNRNVYCFEFSDLVNGCALISREDRNKFSNFRLAIQKRCILFEKIECYYLIEEIYKFL